MVALKAFHLDMMPEQAGMLATALTGIVEAAVVHPCLVTPVGAGLSDGVAYLAMEYVAAESLDVVMRQYAPGAVGTALPFVVQLAEALDTAHAGGLSHGALHLRDVFVTPELARVTGFGVVSALDQVKWRGPLRRPYTAPEQIAGAEWGPAADRFALAAIAYELLTGKRLAGTGEQVTDRLADMAGVRDVTSLKRLFAGALTDAPERRPASARLFANELADAVGWTGADAVRLALVTMDSEAGDPEHQMSDDAPVIAVAGVSARPSAGVETTGTEGATLDMAKIRRESTPEPALDWTERKLDRGESDELRPPEPPPVYEPRTPGTPPDVTRRGRAARGTVPDVDDTIAASAVDVPGGRREAAAGRTPAELPTQQDDDDSGRGRRPAERPPGGGAASPPRSGLLFDQPGEGDDAELDVSGGAASVPVPDNAGADDGEADLSVVQARYRQLDDSPEPPSDAPDSQAAGVYETITLRDLENRPEGRAGGPEDDWDEAEDLGTDLPAGTEAQDDDADGRANTTLMFESDTEDDADDDRYEHDDLQARLIPSGWADRVRGLPVVPIVLMGVVLTVVAFAVGFRLVAGGDDVATDGPSAADAVVAGGVTDPSDAPAPAEPAPQASREFSEATVARSPVVEAPVEAPPASPAPPAATPPPEEPEVSESAGRAPFVASEAPVAPGVLAPTPASPRANGRLLVRSVPPGVRVTVNGEARGITPLALADLSYGAYDIRFSLEGYESQDRRLAISADDPIASIDAELAPVTDTRTASLGVGSIFVDTRPRGVEVWLDRQLVGESPMLIPNVSMGAHVVEFRHAGYRDWATTVQVRLSAQARVTASLDHARR